MPTKLKITYFILILLFCYYILSLSEPLISIINLGLLLLIISFIFSIVSLKQSMIICGIFGILFGGAFLLNKTIEILNNPEISLPFLTPLWIIWSLFIIINVLLYKLDKTESKYKRTEKVKEENKEIDLEIDEKIGFNEVLREKIEDQKIDIEKPEIENKLQMKILEIEKLINDMKYKEAISHIGKVKHDAETYKLGDFMKWADKNKLICNTRIIKKNIIDLGTKFTRLEIVEIIEKTGIDDEELIINTITDMIENNEIYADYFSSTKVVAFNQQAIIKDIDSLMKTYEQWEGEKKGKINK